MMFLAILMDVSNYILGFSGKLMDSKYLNLFKVRWMI